MVGGGVGRIAPTRIQSSARAGAEANAPLPDLQNGHSASSCSGIGAGVEEGVVAPWAVTQDISIGSVCLPTLLAKITRVDASRARSRRAENLDQ